MRRNQPNKKQPKEIVERMRKMRSEGYPLWYIGQKLDLTGVTVWRYTKDIAIIKPRWTQEEEQLLLKLRNEERILMKDIAEKLDKTKSACYKKYYALRDSLKTS
jgi:hypothetical protein